jgi:1-phosphofructokinase family hexose kinase
MIWSLVLNPALDITLQVPSLDPLPDIQYADKSDYQAGGKGHNVARAVRHLGGTVRVAGLYGGATGRRLRELLTKAGIDAIAQEIAGENRTCITVVDGRGGQVELRERGPEVDPRAAAALLQALMAEVQDDDWLVVSGALPPGLAPELLGEIVRRFTPRVRGVLVDTSGPALCEAWRATPYGLTPNEEEARMLETLDGPGPEHLVVTLGPRGAAWTPRGRPTRHKAAPSVPVLNVTGSGDSFMAGLVWALDAGESLPGALDWALAAATASVQQLGVAVFERRQVEALQASLSRMPWTLYPGDGA